MSLSLFRIAEGETRPRAGRANHVRRTRPLQLSPASVLGSLSSVALSPAQATQCTIVDAASPSAAIRQSLRNPTQSHFLGQKVSSYMGAVQEKGLGFDKLVH
jgi:hypothetical protein